MQIESQAYEKTRLNLTNFDRVLPAKFRDQARLAVKDEYTFDLLELGEEHSEREQEQGIERFLREMRGRFAFLGWISYYRPQPGNWGGDQLKRRSAAGGAGRRFKLDGRRCSARQGHLLNWDGSEALVDFGLFNYYALSGLAMVWLARSQGDAP